MKKQITVRYSEAFKRNIVQEYEAGKSVNYLRKKYGVGSHQAIYRWIKKYAHAGLRNELVVIQRAEERGQQKELEARVQQLESALAQMTVEKLILEATVAEAESLLKQDVKKNDKPKSSNGASK